MARHKYNGKWYCDAGDLQGHLSAAALYHQLARARKRSDGAFQNIVNPFYNRKNSRRWVLLETIPPDLRKRLEVELWQASLHQEEALQLLEKDGAPSEDIALAATQITSSAVLTSQPALARALGDHIKESYPRYLEAYYLQGHAYSSAVRYAKTCAFALFAHEQEALISESFCDKKNAASLRELSRHLSSLHLNMQTFLAETKPAARCADLPSSLLDLAAESAEGAL